MNILDPRRHLARALAALAPRANGITQPTAQAAARPNPTTLYGGACIKGAAGVGVLITPEATPRAMRDVAAMLLDAANNRERET